MKPTTGVNQTGSRMHEEMKEQAQKDSSIGNDTHIVK